MEVFVVRQVSSHKMAGESTHTRARARTQTQSLPAICKPKKKKEEGQGFRREGRTTGTHLFALDTHSHSLPSAASSRMYVSADLEKATRSSSSNSSGLVGKGARSVASPAAPDAMAAATDEVMSPGGPLSLDCDGPARRDAHPRVFGDVAAASGGHTRKKKKVPSSYASKLASSQATSEVAHVGASLSAKIVGRCWIPILFAHGPVMSS